MKTTQELAKGTGVGGSLGWDGEHHSEKKKIKELKGREVSSKMKRLKEGENSSETEAGEEFTYEESYRKEKGERKNSSEYSLRKKRAVHSENR